MMTEAGWRLVAVGGIALLSLIVAWAAPRLRARKVAARPLDLSGIEPGVVLFSQGDCPSCDVARERLDEVGVDYREVRFEDDASAHRTAGVTGVPLIVAVGEGGSAAARIAGRPSPRALRALIPSSPPK